MKLTTLVILAILALCLIITEGRPNHERDGPEVKPELDKIQVFRDKSTRDILKRDAMKRLREKHFARFKNSRRPINGRDDDEEDRIYTYREYSDSGCNGNIEEQRNYMFEECVWKELRSTERKRVEKVKNGIITVKTYNNPGCFGEGTEKKYTKNNCTYDADKQKYVKWTW